MLELFLTSIKESFGAKSGLIVLLFVSVYLFFIKIPKILDSINYLTSRKIARMNEAVSSEHINETHKKIFKRELSSIYVLNTFGVKASEKELKKVERLQGLLRHNYSVKEIYNTTKFFPVNQDLGSLTVNDLKAIEGEIKKNRNSNFTSAFSLLLLILFFTYFGIYPILSRYEFGNDLFNDLFLIITYGVLYISTAYTAIIFSIDGVMRNKNIVIVNDRISTIDQS